MLFEFALALLLVAVGVITITVGAVRGKGKVLLAGFVILLASSPLWYRVNEVDRCLDAGGRFDYEVRQCVYE
jgi:NaMN:DMB phosphoribosyltransferase